MIEITGPRLDMGYGLLITCENDQSIAGSQREHDHRSGILKVGADEITLGPENIDQLLG